jgi:hypothetical protein
MCKRRTLLLALALLLLTSLAWLYLRPLDEPKYQDRYLSEWLSAYRDFPYRPTNHAAADVAVRNIGTNALPHLLKWMRYQRPQWKSTLNGNLPRRVRGNATFDRWFNSADHLADYGYFGFMVLGTNAVSAIPELEALMKNQTNPAAALRAMSALRHLGEPGLSSLLRAFADSQQFHRHIIVHHIAYLARDGHADACRPSLLKALTDREPMVRYTATNAINVHVPSLLTNAPAN